MLLAMKRRYGLPASESFSGGARPSARQRDADMQFMRGYCVRRCSQTAMFSRAAPARAKALRQSFERLTREHAPASAISPEAVPPIVPT